LKWQAFSELLGRYKGRSFLVYCPGKNVLEWKNAINQFISGRDLLVIGANNITELLIPHFHIFTNKHKYLQFGPTVQKSSILMLSSRMSDKTIRRAGHRRWRAVRINCLDRIKREPLGYDQKEDSIKGWYKTSGNLAIMLCHLMGADKIYVAGMSGFTYKFDGHVHYYKSKTGREVKGQGEWYRKFDVPVTGVLDRLKAYGIDFNLITPTIYTDHYDGSVIGENL
jgi:hypothetical protein